MSEKNINCCTCGCVLNSNNSRRSFSPRYAGCKIKLDELVSVLPVCSPCLNAEFEKLNTYYMSRQAALFYFAITYDIPIYQEHIAKLPESKNYLNKWLQVVEPYCGAFGNASFRDGDVRSLDDFDLTVKSTKKNSEEPKKGSTQWQGCKEAREKWNDDDITFDDWRRLEALETEQIANRPLIDDAGKAAIRDYCWATLKFEKALKKGDSKSAKNYQDIAEKALKRESLLKAQVNTMEADRTAGFVDYIEKKVGGIPSLKELLDWMFVLVPELYGYGITADAADVVLNDLENHYRENDGQLPLIERPPDKKLLDRLNEFVPEQYSRVKRNTLELIKEYIRTGTFDGMDFSVLEDG